VVRFVQQEGERRGGSTWSVLFAGEEPSKGGAEDVAARPVVAAERGGRGREKNGRLQGEGRVKEAGWKPWRSGGEGQIRFGRFGFFRQFCVRTQLFSVYIQP
jgi:hypothetical protein